MNRLLMLGIVLVAAAMRGGDSARADGWHHHGHHHHYGWLHALGHLALGHHHDYPHYGYGFSCYPGYYYSYYPTYPRYSYYPYPACNGITVIPGQSLQNRARSLQAPAKRYDQRSIEPAPPAVPLPSAEGLPGPRATRSMSQTTHVAILRSERREAANVAFTRNALATTNAGSDVAQVGPQLAQPKARPLVSDDDVPWSVDDLKNPKRVATRN